MDNDIRVVMDKEVYLLAQPAISTSETEIVFRNWLRTGGLTGADIEGAITIASITDTLLPMSVTSVDSAGRWSLLQGSFQRAVFERDQRQYERDLQAYQAEEKKQQAARERGESYTLPPAPRSPDRNDYYEYFPESGEYSTSFKGILRAFGEEALGGAAPLLYEVSNALDQLLRRGFPAAEAATSAPAPINREVLNRLVDEYVSDRGIDWLKDHAKTYETAKKLEISGVNYQRECNIVFLPARIISYSFAGRGYIAVSDPIRNEYMLGTPPAPAKPAIPAAPAGKSKAGLLAGAGAGAVLLIGIGAFAMMHGGKHASPAAQVTAPQQTASTQPAQPSQAQQQAQAQAAAQAKAQAEAQAEAAKAAAAEKAAQEAAAQQAAAQQAAQEAAQKAAQEQAAQAAAEAAAQKAAQEAADKAAAEKAAQLAAEKAAAQKAAQEQAEKEAAAKEAAKEALEAAKEAAAAEAAQEAQAEAARKAAQEAAQKAAQEQAAKEAAAKTAKQSQAAKLAAEAAAAAAAQAQPAVSAPNVTAEPASGDVADNLTAAANAVPGKVAVPAKGAPASKASSKKLAAAKPAPPPVPAAPTPLSGANYEDFSMGKTRLPSDATTDVKEANAMASAAKSHDSKVLSKTVIKSAGGNDIGYYYLGVAAQQSGMYDAARTYYRLSLLHSQLASPPPVCSPHYAASYDPALCHGVVLPGRAERALASLPSN